MAGRVFQSVPAPLNLVIPEHSFPTEGTLLIGVGQGEV
jgi:ubiquinol-cytochrome c reductase iron-sulfur subunit